MCRSLLSARHILELYHDKHFANDVGVDAGAHAYFRVSPGRVHSVGLDSSRPVVVVVVVVVSVAVGSFHILGVDIMVDSDYRLWLVEMNAMPSLVRCSAAKASTIATTAHRRGVVLKTHTVSVFVSVFVCLLPCVWARGLCDRGRVRL